MIFTYFLLFHRLPLHSVVSVIWCREVFILKCSNLIFLFCLSIWFHIQDIIKSSILKLFPYVFFWEFCVLFVFDPFWLTFQSIYFSLIFGIRCQVRVQFYSFACTYPCFLAQFVGQIIFPNWTVLVPFLVKNHLTVYVRVYFRESLFYSIGLYIYLYASTILFWLL